MGLDQRTVEVVGATLIQCTTGRHSVGTANKRAVYSASSAVPSSKRDILFLFCKKR